MTYAKAKARFESAPPSDIRTDYSCKAHGCPNAGSMERGLCYFHWRESDASKWAEITTRIRNNFDVMRNHGQFSPELLARHKAQAQERAKRLS